MDKTSLSPPRFGGMLMTDQRGPDEAVMLMRLAPAGDERFSLEFDGCLVLGALHMTKGPAGLLFDITSTPSVTDGAGKPLPLLENGRLAETRRWTLAQIRLRLRTLSGQGSLPASIVDQLRFFVFETGAAPVTLDWRVQFAGRTYPLGP